MRTLVDLTERIFAFLYPYNPIRYPAWVNCDMFFQDAKERIRDIIITVAQNGRRTVTMTDLTDVLVPFHTERVHDLRWQHTPQTWEIPATVLDEIRVANSV